MALSPTGVYGAPGAHYGAILYGGGAPETLDPNTLEGSSGIPSAEEFGAGGEIGAPPQDLTGSTGIPSGEDFGVGGSIGGDIAGAAGIPSAEHMGVGGALFDPDTLQGATGIESAETFGAGGKLEQNAASIGAGIPSAEAFGRGGIISAEHVGPGGPPLYSVFIAGVDQVLAGHISINSVKINDSLGAASSATFETQDRAGDYRPQNEDAVLILEAGVVVFSGIIVSTEERFDPGSRSPQIQNLRMAIQCSDWSIIADRRIVGETYPGDIYGSLNSIMAAISGKYLEPEGITFAPGDDPGVDLGDVKFDWVTLRDALNQLAAATALDWRVDTARNLYFYDASVGAAPAPFGLTDNSANWRNMVVKRSTGKYRNVQYIKTNTPNIQSTAAYINLKPGESGTIMGWTLKNNYAPSDPANLFMEVFGDKSSVLSLQSSYQLNGFATESAYYLGGSGADPSSSPNAVWVCRVKPVPVTPLEIAAGNPQPGLTPVIVLRRDDQIADMAAITGGTGLIEELETAPDVQDEATARTLADGLLQRYADTGVPVEVTFETDTPGLDVGQTITLAVTRPLVNMDLVISAQARIEEDQVITRHQITANNGPSLGNWQAKFAKLLSLAKSTPTTNYESGQFVLAKTIQGFTNPGLQTGGNITGVRYVIKTRGLFSYIQIQFNTALTVAGQFDVLMDDGSGPLSILSSPIVYPAGVTDLRSYSNFRATPLLALPGNLISVSVLAGGGGADGLLNVVKFA